MKCHVQELRPTIPKGTNPELAKLMEKCWQQRPSKRPDFGTIINDLQHIANEVCFIIFLFFKNISYLDVELYFILLLIQKNSFMEQVGVKAEEHHKLGFLSRLILK